MVMAFPEYQLGSYRLFSGIRENDRKFYSTSAKIVPTEQSLEEEIHKLRQKMEQLAMQEGSFTSDAVVELSNLLDRKINEYMNIMRRKSP
jgi:hypothetical protein